MGDLTGCGPHCDSYPQLLFRTEETITPFKTLERPHPHLTQLDWDRIALKAGFARAASPASHLAETT